VGAGVAVTLPETWHAISPHRIEFQLALINDWIPDDPITIVAKALLPKWVRWHGEQAGLPPHLIDRGIAVATGDIRATPDCAGHRVESWTAPPRAERQPTPTQQQPISHHD
jgi:hypothetical protein